MKRLLMGLAVLPFFAGVAVAGQPLTNLQMDGITAGFASVDVADAEALVGAGKAAFTATATLDQVEVYAISPPCSGTSCSFGSQEASVLLYKSVGGSQSTSLTSSVGTIPFINP